VLPFSRFLLVAAVVLSALPAFAGGWQEVHQTADDVRVVVGEDGVATVEHQLRYRVVAGRFKAFDLPRIDPGAAFEPKTFLVPERGGEIPAQLEPHPKTEGALRLAFDEPRGLGRGVYATRVRYSIDLVAAKMLVRDGAMWQLSWTAPPSPSGQDGARVVFELPSAPTEPRLAGGEAAETTIATLRRSADKDELELVRAHVPRGETPTWTARVDPKAFPRVTAPELRKAAPSRPVPPPNHVPAVLAACALAGCAGLLAYARRLKQAAVARACARAGTLPRPLVPVPQALAPFAFAGATVAGLALLLFDAPLAGTGAVVAALALATHRAPKAAARPRGPGRWLPVPDDEVLVSAKAPRAPGDALDLGTARGRAAFLAISAVVAAVAIVLARRLPGAHIAIPLAATPLLALFATGTRAQLPLGPSDLAVRFVRPARDTLARLVDLSHVDVTCVARFRDRTRTFDEVRLSCVPVDRTPGLRAIELAFTAAGGGAALPEVLIRFDDASEAGERVAQLAPRIAIVPGRNPEEKVLRLSPQIPTARGAARLLATLLSVLEGRRATDRAVASPPRRRPRYAGPERRASRSRPDALIAAAASA
jgi:hypothetical protein